MMEQLPLSKKVGEWEGGDYLITAAEWNSPVTGRSYEIGIRHKGMTGAFHLLRGDWDHQRVQEVANAIGHVLDAGEFYTPEWCQEHFK